MIDLLWSGGFAFGQTNERTNERTDIGGCRVAFATEKCGMGFSFIDTAT